MEERTQINYVPQWNNRGGELCCTEQDLNILPKIKMTNNVHK